MKMLWKDFHFLKVIKHQFLRLKKVLGLREMLRLRVLIVVYLSSLLYLVCSRKWRRRGHQEIQRGLQHPKFLPKRCSFLVQSERLTRMKDQRKGGLSGDKMMEEKSRGRIQNMRLKMTLKSCRALKRTPMKIGQVEVVTF